MTERLVTITIWIKYPIPLELTPLIKVVFSLSFGVGEHLGAAVGSLGYLVILCS